MKNNRWILIQRSKNRVRRAETSFRSKELGLTKHHFLRYVSLFYVGGAAQTCDLSLDSGGDKWNVLLCFTRVTYRKKRKEAGSPNTALSYWALPAPAFGPLEIHTHHRAAEGGEGESGEEG